MHLLLTDRLACPRCGPEFGLVLLADRVVDQRVYRGSLGCPNCRDRYPIEDGRADLRPPPRGPLPNAVHSPPAGDTEPIRIAALLGIPGGPGNVLLLAGVGHMAAKLADLIQGVEWIAGESVAAATEERPGTSHMLTGHRLPFFSGGLRGVVFGEYPSPVEDGIDVGHPRVSLEEAARTLAPRGRVVILSAGPEVTEGLAAVGLDLVLEQDGVVVAARKS